MKKICIAFLLLSILPISAFAAEGGLFGSIDAAIGSLNGLIAGVIFTDVFFFTDAINVPLAVFWLVAGATFFTIYMRFINFRGFRHAIDLVRGKFDKDGDTGEVTHFQALTTALSATVGLGNIAGVAIAVGTGGPGAVFWMLVAGFLGMSAKFAECTLGQMYREVRPDGHIMGGPMEYLSKGIKEMGFPTFGKVLAIIFAVLCIGGSFGGGSAFQVKQSLSAISQNVPFLAQNAWIYGLLMVFGVGVVIIGGIKRIAETASRIVPAMCLIYVLACLFVILSHFSQIPAAVSLIVSQAFAPDAIYGGFIGTLIIGFKRAAFSNEAGIGSAAIAHSAAKTEHPVREGIVALLEPFIDTIVVCSMTALVIVITGAYNNPDYASLVSANEGAALTSEAFRGVISWFPYVLSVCVALFAYSTIISWSYYGERCWSFLFGEKTAMIYRVLLLIVIFIGSITSATNILDFSDLMILSMAFPNILGVLLLSPKVRAALNSYFTRYQAGEFHENKS